MSRVNTIISTVDKNPEAQEPKVWGDLRHQGHARSIWGMASVETTATSKPLWFGSAEGATEQVPVANGQVKPKYPFFNCN
mmetsp:Transcript_33139/g.71437  ORF Transcript_33139/g.71437 Transcript_33139/m.71437 type:complete len:80 (-) Transcript_33139:136-375(-)